MRCEIFGREIGDIGEEGADEYYDCALADAADEALGQDSCVSRARRLGKQRWVHGFDT
jgi:hypothetical protein